RPLKSDAGLRPFLGRNQASRVAVINRSRGDAELLLDAQRVAGRVRLIGRNEIGIDVPRRLLSGGGGDGPAVNRLACSQRPEPLCPIVDLGGLIVIAARRTLEPRIREIGGLV